MIVNMDSKRNSELTEHVACLIIFLHTKERKITEVFLGGQDKKGGTDGCCGVTVKLLALLLSTLLYCVRPCLRPNDVTI